MWRWPFGSGGNRVTTLPPCFPAATSARIMSRMKSEGASGMGRENIGQNRLFREGAWWARRRRRGGERADRVDEAARVLGVEPGLGEVLASSSAHVGG